MTLLRMQCCIGGSGSTLAEPCQVCPVTGQPAQLLMPFLSVSPPWFIRSTTQTADLFPETWGKALNLHVEICVLMKCEKDVTCISECALSPGNISAVKHLYWSSDPQNPNTEGPQRKFD